MAFEDYRSYESGFRRTWTRVDPATRGSAAAAHILLRDGIAADDLLAALLPDAVPEPHG